ncbi:amidase [Lophium mytilinum]|uniref:Amidase n=1 Tax=Lophium mytilinum TaxID=390894 RepID=A0A6A6QBN9_9PEZI|nr:amidase [Lophium mytilinum]
MTRMTTTVPWQDQAQKKRADTWSKIPREWLLDDQVMSEAKSRRKLTGKFIENLLAANEQKITALDSLQLVSCMLNKTFSAEEVATAFCKRAAVAHQLNNCLHEIFFDQALQRARELDQHYAKTGSVLGPLHGLPVSLKDQFHVKGVETTMGYVGWIGTYEGKRGTGKELNSNSQLVDELLSLGAVLYCKTSLPQTLLLGETHNNVNGYTMNPVNQLVSCGGSSGGEAALQALRGSTLGVGTDIGGSVRIPAAFCGTYSIKPTTTRLSYKDVANSNPGQTNIPSSIGLMGITLPSLRLLMTAILSTQPWLRDPDVVPLPWRGDHEYVKASRPLCFGIMATDGVVMPHPPILRGMRLVKEAIEKAGHKTIPWEPPSHAEATNIHSDFMSCDGGANIFAQLRLSKEPVVEEKKHDLGNGPVPPLPLLDFQRSCLRRKAYRASYAAYWNSTQEKTSTGHPVDAVIMPVAPTAAVLPGRYRHFGYTVINNLLDSSCVCIPVTHADKNVDIFDHDYKPKNETDRLNWEGYDVDKYDGAPVGVQVVGRVLQEEWTLSVAETVVDALSEVHQGP